MQHFSYLIDFMLLFHLIVPKISVFYFENNSMQITALIILLFLPYTSLFQKIIIMKEYLKSVNVYGFIILHTKILHQDKS